MRRLILLPLALAGCGDGGASERPQHMLVAAVRKGIYAVKASPGGAIAQFSDVRLYGRNTLCGMVDAQDGFGKRRFSTVAGAEPTIEKSDKADAVQVIERTCTGPARTVTSRNPGFSDVTVEETAH